MKLEEIKMAGFRGVRGEVCLPLASGFVVIAGRNGTGKSTICDAIEFALTGHMRGASGHTEKREGISDYLWWRGDMPKPSPFVELTIVGDDGQRYVVHRSPTEFRVTPNVRLEDVLCHNAVALDSPIVQLCRTTILRDEEITQLSIDLKEAERFEFVRSALGTADFTTVERKAKEVQDVLGREYPAAERIYIAANARVSDLTSRLSQAKTEVSQATEVANAQKALREQLGITEDGTESLLTQTETLLASLRIHLDSLNRLYAKLEDFRRLSSQLSDPQKAVLLKSLSEQLAVTKASVMTYEAAAQATTTDIAAAQAENPRTTSLAILLEHGQRLGLIDECCPLCGSNHSEEEFAKRLAEIARTIANSNAKVLEHTRRSADIAAKLSSAYSESRKLESQIEAATAAQIQLNRDLDVLSKEASLLGITLEDDITKSLPLIAADIEIKTERLLVLDRALAVLQASRAVEQISSLEEDLLDAKAEQAKTEKQMARVRSSQDQVKGALDTIRRVRGEYVDEQLAQLEPLLVELYQRLRPHVDFRDMRYRLRGDVRRMLSFEIGDGLNPSFIFSSGQRRAAGLAFLLAVHLSRSWCSLRTLVLDDPVQHIDDYRALHLTEVLAAIRTTGRQVICTVEDESLGKLLSRRLRSDWDSPGTFVKMDYSSRDGVHVASMSTVQPLRQHLLVPA